MTDQERMLDTLTRLFTNVYQAAGLMWTDDLTAQLTDVVASIYRVPDQAVPLAISETRGE